MAVTDDWDYVTSKHLFLFEKYSKFFFKIHLYIIAVQFGNLFEKYFLKKNFEYFHQQKCV